MRLERFSPDEIAKIKTLASWGHSGDAIAKVIGRDPLSIRKKCCAPGIRLRKASAASRRIKLPIPIWRAL
jgi:hypothetical protein